MAPRSLVPFGSLLSHNVVVLFFGEILPELVFPHVAYDTLSLWHVRIFLVPCSAAAAAAQTHGQGPDNTSAHHGGSGDSEHLLKRDPIYKNRATNSSGLRSGAEPQSI